MNHRLILTLAAASLSLLALSACSTAGSNAGGGASGPSSDSATSTEVLTTANSSLGTIVVDGRGMTVYVFDKDEAGSGTSACTGSCTTYWPPVTTSSENPELHGITGPVGTIGRGDGTTQLTLNGLPLYTYASDEAPGDVKGQGVNLQGGYWWAVGPSGMKITGGDGAGSGGHGY